MRVVRLMIDFEEFALVEKGTADLACGEKEGSLGNPAKLSAHFALTQSAKSPAMRRIYA
jgi:hypothetical protein